VQPCNPLPKGFYDRAGTKQDVDAQYPKWRALIEGSRDPVSPTVTDRGHFICEGEVIHYVDLDDNIRVNALYYDSAVKAMGSDIIVGADMQRQSVIITEPARGWKTIIMQIKQQSTGGNFMLSNKNRAEYLGGYSVPDGYAGNRIIAHVVLQDDKILHVYPFGVCRSPFLQMRVHSAREARWLVNNDPLAKKYYRKEKTL